MAAQGHEAALQLVEHRALADGDERRVPQVGAGGLERVLDRDALQLAVVVEEGMADDDLTPAWCQRSRSSPMARWPGLFRPWSRRSAP